MTSTAAGMSALPRKLIRRMRGAFSPGGPAEPGSAPGGAPSPDAGNWILQLDARFLLDEATFSVRLAQIDAELSEATPAERAALFEDIPQDVFTLLCLHRPDRYPNISAWLPTFPPEWHQINSTGAAGPRTMMEASRFVAATAARYGALGRDIRTARLLDFGICWARISRLFYKHVPTDQLYGVDAWPTNLESARECGYAGQLALVDEFPSRLPFEGLKFDLVVAFSVFTHLSEASAAAALAAIRAGMTEDGLLAITLRPRAFADIVAAERREPMGAGADASGFGFFPEPWSPGALYGDSIVTLDYVRERWTGFELIGVDVNAADPYQLYAFLRPR